MAVTFTDKAAGELRARLAALGAVGVRASTFHSAALRQLRHFAPERLGAIMPSKVLLLRQIANRLPAPYKFRPAGDLATEIEWAKNRRIPPERYGDREPPIPIDLMKRVYVEYEERKQASGAIDFEDLLELAVQLFEEDAGARETFRAQYHAFTVDEYQDVNLLQQSLLDLWLGDRDDLCVVGDDYQSIYAFTGAGPEHLLGMPDRFPHAQVFRLEENYRSSPQVLELANKLVPRLGGAEKTLRAVRPDGPEPVVRPYPTEEDGGRGARRRDPRARLPARGGGDPRADERAADRLRAGAARRRASRIQGASLLDRDAARRLCRRLERSPAPAAEAVRAEAVDSGVGRAAARQAGRAGAGSPGRPPRLVELATEFDGNAAAFVADLRERFAPGSDAARGIHLLTFHRAKGLEFEAVFLPRLQDKELPSKQARSEVEIAEERRLLYVGLTRAKRLLWLSWSGSGRGSSPSSASPRRAVARAEGRLVARRPAAARMAARAREGGRRAAVRRLPRLGAARDRCRASGDAR